MSSASSAARYCAAISLCRRPAGVGCRNRRGGKVFLSESHPVSVSGLFDYPTVDGFVANRLGRALHVL